MARRPRPARSRPDDDRRATMEPSRKRQRHEAPSAVSTAEPASGGCHHGRQQQGYDTADSHHVVVHTVVDNSSADDVVAPPCIDPANTSTASLLEQLIWPMDVDTFTRGCFRKKAVATTCCAAAVTTAAADDEEGPPPLPPLARRVQALAEALEGLELVPMMERTASSEIQVWMGRPTHDAAAPPPPPGAREEPAPKIASFPVAEPTAARCCYEAGASLYFAAPPEMLGPWVGRLTADLGYSLACGQNYQRAQQQMGEIEVFVSRAGHTTGWHIDFQENFTVQLRGRKRWRLARSELSHPIRAFTPHFRGDNDIDEQLKCQRLQSATFGERAGGPVTPAQHATVDIGPGGTLYHPAGMDCDNEVALQAGLHKILAGIYLCRSHLFLVQQLRWQWRLQGSGIKWSAHPTPSPSTSLSREHAGRTTPPRPCAT
eukprot:SAG25_NODE_256_length_10933_cov_24.263522_15_plen_431_part_00